MFNCSDQVAVKGGRSGLDGFWQMLALALALAPGEWLTPGWIDVRWAVLERSGARY